MREIRLSGLEGGVVDIRHPYPYFIAKVAYPSTFLLFFSGTVAGYLQHVYGCLAAVPLKNKRKKEG